MRDSSAVVFLEPGGPDVLHLRDLVVAEPGPREARVRVVAAGVHPTDLVLRAGLRPLAGAGPHVPGMAVAGVVAQVGEGSVWNPGDRVMGMTLPSSPHGGGYRASVIAPDDTLAAVPAGIDLHAAATLPMNGHTALQALRRIEASAGQTVLVTGAAGALGAIVVPLAVERGVRVIAVAREHDEPRVRALGADAFVAAGADLAARVRVAAGGPVHAVIDLAVLDDQVMPAVREGGAIATLRGWTGTADGAARVEPLAVPQEWHSGAQLEQLAHPRFLTRAVLRIAPDDAAQAHLLLLEAGLRESIVLDFS